MVYFSEKFGVDANIIQKYGAVDISLVCDMPLFIDPMLIFNSDDPKYQELHNEMIQYFHFLFEKSKKGLTPKEISAWFNFSEVPNNWLGYSFNGNKGLALGMKYSTFLYENIGFAIETNDISKSEHIEKAMLLYEGSGKDKISDLTVNLIKGFLCNYTELFAQKYIDASLCAIFYVDKAYFNYETESFISKEYYLPYVVDARGRKEFVLLTPLNILREDEPSINRRDFFESNEHVRGSIENDTLRAYVNNYIAKAVNDYTQSQERKNKKPSEKTIRKIEENAFRDMVSRYPVLYDYYIALQENNTTIIREKANREFNLQHFRFIDAAKQLIEVFSEEEYGSSESLTAREEAKKRIVYFKHIIEDCDGYKSLYVEGRQITQEADLQRLFKFVWYGTGYKVDAEANNGRGQADFIVSKGSQNQNIIEFKLAKNPKLIHVFEQVQVYENANQAEGSLIAIFFFTAAEQEKAHKMIVETGCEEEVNNSVFLIDCRNDNKESASLAKR